MKILITGGAGFIGSHLAESLLSRGHQVTVLDDLSTGRLANLAHLQDHQAFRFVEGSVLNREIVGDLVAAANSVYHLAAAVGVRLIYEQPIQTIETNVNGTQVVLEAVFRNQCKIFIASTSEVYGKDVPGRTGKFRETDELALGTSIRWCYASSKVLDEYLARAYFQERGLKVIIGRLFNTVGPRQTGAYGMVIPRFVDQALTGRPITIYGDGYQIRTFTWVGDSVNAAMKLMETPAAVGQVFNIGSEETVTIEDLARRIVRMTRSSSPIVHVPYEEAFGPEFEDTRSRVPDISRLKETIGYEPTLTLDDILQRVIGHSAATIPGASR